MPDYIVNPQTGETLSIPDEFGRYVGLPRADVANPADDPADETGWTPVQGSPRQSVDEMLAIKKAKYEKLGASPDQMAKWLDIDRNRYEKYVRDVTKPPPGSPPEAVDAWLAKSPSHAPGSPTQYVPPSVAAMLASNNGVAHLTQSTAPLGTIGMIGKDGSGSLPAESPAYATQADLDGALAEQQAAPPPVAPVDPSKPEQAGLDLSREGLAMGAQAAQQTAAADARAAGFEEREIARRNAEADRIRAETEKQNAERQKRFEDLNAKYSNATEEWAKTKIDPGRRWKNASTGSKIAAAISVAMSALGDALQRKSGPNLALQIIDKAIQDDIDLQVQDREHKGAIANRARTSLDDYRKETADWREARQLKLSEEYRRTADEIERIAAGSRNEKAKANGLAMAGEYRTRAGALEQGVATAAWNREMKEQEFAEQKRNARVSQGLQAQGLDLQRQELADRRAERQADREAQLAQLNAKTEAEKAKMLRELGVDDPSTGKQWLDANGQPILARTEAEAKELRKTVKDTQSVLSQIDELRKKAKGLSGQIVASKTADEFNTKLGALQLQIKEAYKLGTLDKGSVEFLDKLTGGDPSKITASGIASMLGIGNTSGERVEAKLAALADSIEKSTLTQLGNPAGVKFTRAEELKPTAVNKATESLLQGTPTTAKAVQDQEPGALAKGLQDVESFVFGTTQKYKGDRKAAEERGNSARYPGFRADKEAALDTLVNAAQSGDEQAKTRIVEMVGNQKVPGLSPAAMTLVDTVGDPELTARAEAALPADVRAQRRAIQAARGPGIQLYPGRGAAPAPVQSTASPFISPEMARFLADQQLIRGGY